MTTTVHRQSQRRGISPTALPKSVSFGHCHALVRPLEAADTGRLIEFFASHAPETIHQRYGYTLVQMTPEHACRLVNVDQSRDVALGVFEDRGQGTVLIAIGRYYLANDGQSAEVAFVVREDRRCRGICTLLLDTLANFAMARGIRRLVAQVQHDNVPMLSVFRCAGATIRAIEGVSEMEVALPIAPPNIRPAGQRRRTRTKTAALWLRRAGRRTRQRLQALALRVPLNPPLP